MRNFPRLRVALLGLGLFAVSMAGAAEIKIGVVNAARVSAEAPQSEAAREKLEREFAPRDQELVAMQKEVREMEERLTRDGAVMKEADQRTLEREIVSRKREIRRMQDEFREDFNMRRNEELGKLQRQIIETIQQLAKDEKFDLILSDGVIYASDKVDVTGRVIEMLSRGAGATRR